MYAQLTFSSVGVEKYPLDCSVSMYTKEIETYRYEKLPAASKSRQNHIIVMLLMSRYNTKFSKLFLNNAAER